MTVDKNHIFIAARERGPGPGRYALPNTCGFSQHDPRKHIFPAYSFGKRLPSDNKIDSSPGPVYYVDPPVTRHGKDGTPHYSMLGRQKSTKKFKTPSPGTYSPEKVHPQGERHAPVYSVSARTKHMRCDHVPASNWYHLPPLLGSRQANKQSYPSYTMTGRNDVGCYCEDLSMTPGPGRYNAIEPNTIRTKRPQYSLQGRSNIPGDKTQKPGPGAHIPENVTINKKRAPQCSLGIRHTEFSAPVIEL